jgi:hypothetical protein
MGALTNLRDFDTEFASGVCFSSDGVQSECRYRLEQDSQHREVAEIWRPETASAVKSTAAIEGFPQSYELKFILHGKPTTEDSKRCGHNHAMNLLHPEHRPLRLAIQDFLETLAHDSSRSVYLCKDFLS